MLAGQRLREFLEPILHHGTEDLVAEVHRVDQLHLDIGRHFFFVLLDQVLQRSSDGFRRHLVPRAHVRVENQDLVLAVTVVVVDLGDLGSRRAGKLHSAPSPLYRRLR